MYEVFDSAKYFVGFNRFLSYMRLNVASQSRASLDVPANSSFYIHSFLPRTSRNLRGFP